VTIQGHDADAGEIGEDAAATDPALFRRILGHFCSGIVIVTALEGQTPIGMTCQSFSSLSLDPPLVLFSPAHTSTTWPRINAVGTFAINILSDEQEQLCRGFAVSGADKFAGVAWHPGVAGAPLLDGALAHIECRTHSILPGGDHDIVIGAPIALGEDPARSPLLFFRSSYGRFVD
jgi:3-hydroxy-9,10-secoandrosta-1,3,5(10)-triene-9,17-dione monooxygenase reductase component